MGDAERSAADSGVPDATRRVPRGTGRRLHGAIAQKLGVAILSGEYVPGDTLSGEGSGVLVGASGAEAGCSAAGPGAARFCSSSCLAALNTCRQ